MRKHTPIKLVFLRNSGRLSAEAYKLALPYVQKGFKPSMTSVRTVTPDIHFPGYCPSPIPEYVTSLKKQYSEPTVFTYKHEYVQKRLVETKPGILSLTSRSTCLLPLSLTDNSTLYDIKSLLYAFRPIVGLKLEKELFRGICCREIWRVRSSVAWDNAVCQGAYEAGIPMKRITRNNVPARNLEKFSLLVVWLASPIHGLLALFHVRFARHSRWPSEHSFADRDEELGWSIEGCL